MIIFLKEFAYNLLFKLIKNSFITKKKLFELLNKTNYLNNIYIKNLIN
jgi:hypothetical protein